MEDNYILMIREKRFINSGLVNKYKRVEDCVRDHLGIQAQYTNYAIISILLRTDDDITINEIYASDVIRAWVQRETVHLITRDDFLAINNLRSSKKAWVYDYYIKHRINCKDVINYISSLDEPVLSKVLSSDIKKKYGYYANQWSAALILANVNELIYSKLTKEGIVFNKFDSKVVRKATNWQSMYERYLLTYGPANVSDFSHWSGRSIKELGIVNKTDDNHENENIEIEYPIILSKFDPLMVAYRDKSWIVVDNDPKIIWKTGGQIEAVIVSREGIIATWRMKCSNTKFEVFITSLRSINLKDRMIIENRFKMIATRMNRDKFSITFEGV